MNRPALYDIESRRREAVLRGDQRGMEAAEHALAVLMNAHSSEWPQANAFAEVKRMQISDGLFLQAQQWDRNASYQSVDPFIESSRSFVSDELGVDLSATVFVRWDAAWTQHEATTLTCRDADHVMMFPLAGSKFEAPDALAHEFGHAAEHTLRRQSGDDRLLIQHPIISETVAHYCQCKYLLEHGSSNDRLGMVGSILPLYIVLQAILATMEARTKVMVPDQALNNERVRRFVGLYGEASVSRLLHSYSGQPIGDTYFSQVECRFGAFIALRLIDHPEAIRQLCMATPDRPLRQTLEGLGLDAAQLLDFSDVSSLLRSFIDGSIRTGTVAEAQA